MVKQHRFEILISDNHLQKGSCAGALDSNRSPAKYYLNPKIKDGISGVK